MINCKKAGGKNISDRKLKGQDELQQLNSNFKFLIHIHKGNKIPDDPENRLETDAIILHKIQRSFIAIVKMI